MSFCFRLELLSAQTPESKSALADLFAIRFPFGTQLQCLFISRQKISTREVLENFDALIKTAHLESMQRLLKGQRDVASGNATVEMSKQAEKVSRVQTLLVTIRIPEDQCFGIFGKKASHQECVQAAESVQGAVADCLQKAGLKPEALTLPSAQAYLLEHFPGITPESFENTARPNKAKLFGCARYSHAVFYNVNKFDWDKTKTGCFAFADAVAHEKYSRPYKGSLSFTDDRGTRSTWNYNQQPAACCLVNCVFTFPAVLNRRIRAKLQFGFLGHSDQLKSRSGFFGSLDEAEGVNVDVQNTWDSTASYLPLFCKSHRQASKALWFPLNRAPELICVVKDTSEIAQADGKEPCVLVKTGRYQVLPLSLRAPKSESLCLISGPKRSGKSTMAVKLLMAELAAGSHVRVYTLDSYEYAHLSFLTDQCNFFESTFGSIEEREKRCQELQKKPWQMIVDCRLSEKMSNFDLRYELQAMIGELQQLSPKKRPVVVLDEIGKAVKGHEDFSETARILRRLFALIEKRHGTLIVVSGIWDFEVSDEIQSWPAFHSALSIETNQPFVRWTQAGQNYVGRIDLSCKELALFYNGPRT